MKRYPEFKVSNIPIANLLGRFISLYTDFQSQIIIDYLKSHINKSLDDKRFYFFQFTNEFYSFILRNVIMCFESYLRYSLWDTAHRKSRKDVLKLLKNPSHADRQVAKVAFDVLPSKFDPKFSLQNHNKPLYDYMLQFYKNFRNPLFHGDQLNPGTDIDSIIKILEIYKELYLWIASWTSADLLLREDKEGNLDLIDRQCRK